MAGILAIHRAAVVLALTVCLGAPALAVDLIGYVPNYRMGAGDYARAVLPAQLPLLDEVRYFGVSVDAAANLTTTGADLKNLATIKSLIDRLPAPQRPRLGVTIGGWGKSAGFSTVAASEGLRDKFAQNLDALLDQTGAAAIDLDWEHPAAGAECDSLYPAMLTRIKQVLGPGRRVYATLEPTTFIAARVLTGPHAIDGVSLMTYDLSGWSNADGVRELGPHSSHQQVEDSVGAWTDKPGTPNQRPAAFATWGQGVPTARLGIGLPLYGRGFHGANAKSSAAYRDLVANGKTSDGNAYRYRDADYWIPSLDAVRDRMKYAEVKGLQHVILWEMTQDLPPSDKRSMLRAADAARLP